MLADSLEQLRPMNSPVQQAMNFVAIDFETANSSRCSPCAIGMTVVEAGAIVHSRQWLIRPQDMRFDSFNVAIHGITPEMVRNEPEFVAIWPELQPYLVRYPVVAHNAAFDISVLRKTLDLYDLKYPVTSYLCSVVLAKITWPGLPSYRLDCLSDHLGFELKHHNAGSDATGAAYIVTASAGVFGTSSFSGLIDTAKIRIGALADGWYQPCRLPEGNRYTRQNRPRCNRIPSPQFESRTVSVGGDHPLSGKVIVFTGKLQTMSRTVAAQEVNVHGGTCVENINAETDYLVVGSFNAATMREGGKSSKLRKAEQLAAEGQPIEIIGEEDFLRLL